MLNSLIKYILLIISFNSFSQEQFNDSVYVTHTINNVYLENSLKLFFQTDSFQKLKVREYKRMVVTAITRSDEVLIRIIPLFDDFCNYKDLNNNYKGYFVYNDFHILFYGDASLLLENGTPLSKNSFAEIQPEERIYVDGIPFIQINHPEYYGMEFIYLDGKLIWKEENYFGEIVPNNFPSKEFYDHVIYKIKS